MKSLKGSITAVNLMKAFAGETQARTRYTLYAELARCEGYIQIADIFEETANQEKGHARKFYQILSRNLNGEEIKIEENFPVALYNDAIKNLKSAVMVETYEAEDLYPGFAKIAEEEGYPEVAIVFTEIAEVEEWHAERFQALVNNIKNDQVFRREEPVLWQCINCGYIHEGKEAPLRCPACSYPQEYFKLLCVDF